MIDLVDIDAIFEARLRKYMEEHAGEYSEDAWEEKIAELYEAFGSERLAELGGKSPEKYYAGEDGAALVGLLARHVREGVAVSDYLCEAIMDADGAEEPLISLLGEAEEELVFYAMNLLKDMGSVKPLGQYLDFLLDPSVGRDRKELCTEILCEYPDRVKESILEKYKGASEEDRSSLLDILSHAQKDDRILRLLTDALLSHAEEIPLYAAFVRRYGDEKALSALYELIEREEINYQDFQELKLAIESLGGEYEKERDFSNDKVYRKIMEQKKGMKS
jgi:hypothetical protein